MKRKLVIVPDPILRQVASPISENKLGTAFSRDLKSDLLDIMYKNKGIGLAAPQAGESLRALVINLSGDPKGHPYVFFNPIIVKQKGVQWSQEGCLSMPDQKIRRPRFSQIKVKSWDEEGRDFQLKASGLLSCCLQHEIDHLNGILMTDEQSSKI